MILKEHYSKSQGGVCVGIVKSDGQKREYLVCTLVARAFLGKSNLKQQAIHKNGIKGDNRAKNLMYIQRTKIGNIVNASKRKAVFKIASTGEIVNVYKSARECADKNNINYATLKKRCAGKKKNVFAKDGFAYCYETNYTYLKSLDKAIGLEDY